MIQLGYFTIDTQDVDKAKAFYSALFGWTFDEDASKPTYAHVSGSDPAFGFTKVERAGQFPHLYFRVDDVDAVCRRVTELGGKAAAPADSASGRSAVVSDDQGVSFSVWQPAPGF
ncbi:VOC family protein [Brevundimonas sp. Root1423]|uniref:VOC family protein n=1 Tax=Brevundimonas sp. Root1423 TaxID=1736462 RepID=UPI0006F89B6D|nr:VOC family protein [Brevundimonas sp. Root1423]KQY96469.1 bleomycin resistance protein [Brevundimonas sp. Root1423]